MTLLLAGTVDFCSRIVDALDSNNEQAQSFPVLRTETLNYGDDSSFDFDRIEWVVFTSRLSAEGYVLPTPLRESTKIAAVGGGCADALRERGIRVDLQGDGGAKALAKKLRAELSASGRILFPGAREPRPELADAFGEALIHIPVYATHIDEVILSQLVDNIRKYATLVVGSAKVARALIAEADKKLLERCNIVAIGATTAAELSTANLRASVPPRPSAESVAEHLRGMDALA